MLLAQRALRAGVYSICVVPGYKVNAHSFKSFPHIFLIFFLFSTLFLHPQVSLEYLGDSRYNKKNCSRENPVFSFSCYLSKWKCMYLFCFFF